MLWKWKFEPTLLCKYVPYIRHTILSFTTSIIGNNEGPAQYQEINNEEWNPHHWCGSEDPEAGFPGESFTLFD